MTHTCSNLYKANHKGNWLSLKILNNFGLNKDKFITMVHVLEPMACNLINLIIKACIFVAMPAITYRKASMVRNGSHNDCKNTPKRVSVENTLEYKVNCSPQKVTFSVE